jgi:hypothetical protein
MKWYRDSDFIKGFLIFFVIQPLLFFFGIAVFISAMVGYIERLI